MLHTGRKPVVVLATDSTAPSGVGEHMLTLGLGLRATHDVVMAFPTAGEGQSFLDRAERMSFWTTGLADDEASVSEWLASSSADILHVHAGIAWEGQGLTSAGRKAGTLVIRTEHLPFVLTDEHQMAQHRASLDNVDHTIFVSAATAATYRDARQTGESTTTIKNGIGCPQPVHSRETVREMLGIEEHDQVVLTVARFTKQKGLQYLVAAAAQVLSQRKNVKFAFVGCGPDRTEVEAQCAALGFASRMMFLGERRDVADLLAAADLFVLPSLFEGLPLVILEAMACGLPIVTTRIGGTMEALGRDYPWLVAPADDIALSDALGTALTDRWQANRLGMRNRKRFVRQFGAERMAAQTAALYASVMSKRYVLS